MFTTKHQAQQNVVSDVILITIGTVQTKPVMPRLSLVTAPQNRQTPYGTTTAIITTVQQEHTHRLGTARRGIRQAILQVTAQLPGHADTSAPQITIGTVRTEPVMPRLSREHAQQNRQTLSGTTTAIITTVQQEHSLRLGTARRGTRQAILQVTAQLPGPACTNVTTHHTAKETSAYRTQKTMSPARVNRQTQAGTQLKRLRRHGTV